MKSYYIDYKQEKVSRMPLELLLLFQKKASKIVKYKESSRKNVLRICYKYKISHVK
jgi:hypothetical protein